nr:hypothetical protein [Clostridiales bacterium]
MKTTANIIKRPISMLLCILLFAAGISSCGQTPQTGKIAEDRHNAGNVAVKLTTGINPAPGTSAKTDPVEQDTLKSYDPAAAEQRTEEEGKKECDTDKEEGNTMKLSVSEKTFT